MKHDFEISNGVLRKYHGNADSVVIPEDVTEIGWSAFEHQSTILSVEISEGVTNIDRFAFYGCKRLVDIHLPNSLTTIREGAFRDCSSLADIAFPEGITHIGSGIFEGCQSLDEITIFGEVFTIGELIDEYDWGEIAEDYGIDEDEICNLTEAVHDVVASELPFLLINAKFDDLYMPESLRYELIACALKHKPTNINFLNMVREHLTKIFIYLLKEPEIVQYFIENAVFTDGNIDSCIRIANDGGDYEIQLMLKEHKCQNNF